jgi:hypothetical protein
LLSQFWGADHISQQGLKEDITDVVKEIFDRAWNDEIGSLKASGISAEKSIEELNTPNSPRLCRGVSASESLKT